MAGIWEAFEGVHTLLDMLGSLIRKAIRGKRTTLFREWRYRDNTWLAHTTIIGGVVAVTGVILLIWLFIVT